MARQEDIDSGRVTSTLIRSNRVAEALRKLDRKAGVPSASPVPAVDWSHALQSGVTLRVRGESDWYVFNEVFVDLDYDQAIDLLIHQTDSSDRPIVVDLGANMGYFAARVADRLAMLGRSADVVSVEGSPSVFAQLQARVPEYSVGQVSIRAIHGLAGHREGTATISEVPFGARNSLYAEHNAAIAPIETMAHHEVGFVDLDELVGADRRVALLKCDIEGAEELFVQTYSTSLLRRTDAAVFEFHHRWCEVDRCLSLLHDCGLRTLSSRPQQDETSLVLLTRAGD